MILYEVGLLVALGIFLVLGFTSWVAGAFWLGLGIMAAVVFGLTMALSYLVFRHTREFSGKRLATWFVTLMPGMIAMWLLVIWLLARPEESLQIWGEVALNSLYILVPAWVLTGLGALISWLLTRERRVSS